MAIVRVKEARELTPELLEKKIEELTVELNAEMGTVASGGKASNAGRIKEIRRTIARLLTIKREKETASAKPEAKAPKTPSKKKEITG
ncbi:MAG: 50S ribosomal protein L29 [Candidatus Micrarchaeota archaeon]